MRTDARSIFIVALLLFIVVSGWRLWEDLLKPQPEAEQPAAESETAVTLSRYRQLGVLKYLSDQFSGRTLVVPVNPFRPTFEAMVRNPESGDLRAVVAGRGRGGSEDGGPRWGAGGEQGDAGRGRGGQHGGGGKRGEQNNAARGRDAPAISRYAFQGMFERPDGKIAAYITGTLEGGRFLTVNDELGDATIVSVSDEAVVLRLKDDTTVTFEAGDTAKPLKGAE